ncbi:MAG TPA: glycosyltransferase family 2 protein [Candidatus Eisenbacteria bacterium]
MSGRPIPLLSIGLPVFNGEDHLALALDSLLAQTVDDFEIIISDNHSTDTTELICRDFAARDPRIRYVRGVRNLGVAWNFNNVFHLARGRYFKWASSNDVHDPQYSRRCLEVLESNAAAVLAYARTNIIDEHGAVVQAYEDRLDLPWPEPPRRFREYLDRVGLCNALFGVMRPEVMRRTALLGDYPGSDIIFLGEMSLHGTFVEVPAILFSRRYEHANVVHNSTLANWQEFFAPSKHGKFVMRTWRHLYEYFRADLRSPLSVADKARVAGTIARASVYGRRQLLRELTGAARQIASRRTESPRL